MFKQLIRIHLHSYIHLVVVLYTLLVFKLYCSMNVTVNGYQLLSSSEAHMLVQSTHFMLYHTHIKQCTCNAVYIAGNVQHNVIGDANIKQKIKKWQGELKGYIKRCAIIDPSTQGGGSEGISQQIFNFDSLRLLKVLSES